MKTIVYRAVSIVFDFEGYGIKGVKSCLETVRGVDADVLALDGVEVDWSDDHPLNKSKTFLKAVGEIFPCEWIVRDPQDRSEQVYKTREAAVWDAQKCFDGAPVAPVYTIYGESEPSHAE